jgi:exonuclease SbcC
MLPIALTLKNFLAYRSPQPVRFEGIHLACLTGPNGAGKSSLLDAITWALWGEARAKDSELIHSGQDDMSVQLDFQHGTSTYRVLRKRTRRGTPTLQFFAHGESGANELTDLTEGSIRATQEAITRLIRLDYRTFVASAFLQQGKADAFTVMPPRERKDVLAKMLDLSRFDAYEKAAREKARQYDSEVELDAGRIGEIDAELATRPDVLRAHEKANRLYDAVRDAPRDRETALNERARLEDERAKALREARRERAEAEKAEAEIAALDGVIADGDEIRAGYETLQTAQAALNTLSEQLAALRRIDDRCGEQQRTIDAAKAALERDLARLDAQIAALEKTARDADRDAYMRVQSEIDALGDLDAQRKAADHESKEANTERVKLESANTALVDFGKKRKKRIEDLERVDGALCPLCGAPLDDAHRAELLGELKREREADLTQHQANAKRAAELAAEVKRLDSAIDAIEANRVALRRLQKEEAVLRTAIEQADTAARDLQPLTIERAGVRAKLESGDYAHDARAALTTIEAERAAIAYDDGQHRSARADLDRFSGYTARFTRLQSALDQRPLLVQKRDQAAERADAREDDAARSEADLHALGERLAGLEARVKEAQEREAACNRAIADRQKAEEHRLKQTFALNALEEQEANRARIEARLAANRIERACYAELADAFGKKGIPAWLIETALPELETEANRLLRQMTDGRMTLKLSTQRDKTTGDGVIETLDIDITDELGTRSYDLFSGGEAFRINFALRIALSQFLARRSGAQLETLFIDEGFGTQDEDGRNKLVEAITAVQDDFSLILIITHIEELRDAFPVHITVEKQPDGSRIQVR